MDVKAWSLAEEDPGRNKRLAFGYAAGVAIIAAAVGVAANVRGAERPIEEEETIVDVQLTPSVEKPAPPPPPPPPTPAPQAPKPVGRKAIVAPVEVPKELPPETNEPAKPSDDDDPYADGKGGVIGGSLDGDPNAKGAAVAPAATTAAPSPPPPPPPPPPKRAGPVSLPENATPPSPISNPPPPYPAEARSEGIQATVVVKFVVTENGEVTNVTIVRGHPMFDAVVLATVRTWRFSPAMVDGKPISVYRSVRIPFKIKM